MKTAITLILFVAAIATVEPHGFVRIPLSRTSIFREPSWGAQPPFWWDDTGLWCGNVQQNLQYSTCGRCGDAPGNSHAAQGGRYDNGIITGTYVASQVVEVTMEITTNSRGHFEFDLCPQVIETDTCFQRLNIVGGDRQVRNGNMMCSGSGGNHPNGPVRARIHIPPGVRCTRCTLRWTYRTSHPPGKVAICYSTCEFHVHQLNSLFFLPIAPDACFNPNLAQTFRNCVDIRID
ncbi:hypothetical protein HA402_015069 [Bradysia odoriphaga]|nr:hypothetical protein HA402_015069 [Bradysia odoriphaga]